MKNIPPDLVSFLKSNFKFGSMSVETEQVSTDGTRKLALRLRDGQIIESLLMAYRDGRYSACISSQAGCAMKCVFCATGQMGFSRQLSASEIFEQTQMFSSYLRKKGKRLSNVVMMGMGEPLNNYENVIHAVKKMNSDLNIGARSITISTVGIVPRIKRLADENIQVIFF